MSNAIWALIYDITQENLGEYLAWFHEVHIPEKLARDGYEWAGHYKGCSQQSTRYIAFFGGISTRTFFDPSPKQLKTTQDELTRKMIGMRQNPCALVFTEEWDVEGPDINKRPGDAIIFACANTANDEEDYCAWLAQKEMPAFALAQGSVRGRKLLAATGPAKHGVLYQFTTELARDRFLNSRDLANMRLSYKANTPLAANRIWPQDG
ncbi:MAG: hypothetical protein CMM76_15890 [Rhodospirillaceae bacterium]|nr:hypothetical protein [Rhodospirillaceae bacterium]|tara:strand:- start:887 stop:1510 length:624 start_codon:yes stop_codon:yes gene_type:complete